MLVDMLVDNRPSWFYKEAPEGSMALFCQCTLSRNLPDVPFVRYAADQDKAMVEERILQVLDNLNLKSKGKYYSFADLDPVEVRFLAERQLITQDLISGSGPRGVYVAADQNVSIMINALDHVTIRVLCAGLQLQECWTQAVYYEENLNKILGFAFDEQLGYLTAQLRNVGTALKSCVLLHLPALAMTGSLQKHAERIAGQRLALQGITAGSESQSETLKSDKKEKLLLSSPIPDLESFEARIDQSLYSNMDGILPGTLKASLGDMYLLVNESTLGLSEDEILFHVRHAASKIITEERGERKRLMAESKRSLEDKIGRARGIASGARLLGFAEGLQLLSAIRLGVDLHLDNAFQPVELNTLMLQSQGAQLEMAKGRACDAYTLNMERAELFRSRFSVGMER